MLAYGDSNFINIGERCNVAGSTVFKRHILKDDYSVRNNLQLSYIKLDIRTKCHKTKYYRIEIEKLYNRILAMVGVGLLVMVSGLTSYKFCVGFLN